MNRRKFIQCVAGAALASQAGPARLLAALTPGKADLKLRPLEYTGVRLLPGPFADRLAATRDYVFNFSDDDLLKGFREHAKVPAPGQHLGGWCGKDSGMIFGQWLSGMARLFRATGDAALRDKALRLMTEWGKTLPSLACDHYIFDKYVCGLVDLAAYANASEALPLLARLVDWGDKHLKRDRLNATDADSQGGFFNNQMEWYTLSENLYRAFLLTGDERYRKFGDVWLYPHYWGMFNGQTPGTPDGFHGYSHVNTLSSAAMAYAVTGEAAYLKTITGAYDYFQKTQCYATGGYGPGEKLMAPDGALGRSVDEPEPNVKFLEGLHGRSFETPCGTWAVFKLCRYLQSFTGEARYGDWTERVLYNGIGAALPIRGRGETFYYADYRMKGARKSYFGAPFPCCAGSYVQDVTELPNALYYTNAAGLRVNLYVPSEVAWNQDGQRATLTQRTTYPESETVSLSLTLAQPAAFTLGLRVPVWAQGVTARINDQPAEGGTTAGTWLDLRRRWTSGDRVDLRIPLPERAVPIDEQHPKRVARVRGPVVMVRPQDSAEMIPFYKVGPDGKYEMYADQP